MRAPSAKTHRWPGVFDQWLDRLGGGDAAHDREHVHRVVRTALRLCAKEGAEKAVVLPAAWLHDCVAVPKSSPDRRNASKMAAARAAGFLTEAGYPARHIAAIAHAIEAHSFSAGIPARTIEAKVVQDADRIDALGAVGIARCLALGGAMGRVLYAARDPFCLRRPPDDGRYTLDHFPAKLLTLSKTMQTDSGRVEAERRTALIRIYLKEFKREIA